MRPPKGSTRAHLVWVEKGCDRQRPHFENSIKTVGGLQPSSCLSDPRCRRSQNRMGGDVGNASPSIPHLQRRGGRIEYPAMIRRPGEPRGKPAEARDLRKGDVVRIGYFDCFSGISGDMTLGRWSTPGVDPGAVLAAVKKPGTPCEVAFETVRRGGFRDLRTGRGGARARAPPPAPHRSHHRKEHTHAPPEGTGQADLPPARRGRGGRPRDRARQGSLPRGRGR